MPKAPSRSFATGLRRLGKLGQVHLLLMVPILMIAGYAFAGHPGLTGVAVICCGLLSLAFPHKVAAQDATEGPILDRKTIVERADRHLGQSLFALAVFTLEVDRYKHLAERFEHSQIDDLLRQCADRLITVLGPRECVARLDGPTFAVLAGPDQRLDMETGIQVAARIQAALASPFVIDGSSVQITVSVGIGLSNRLQAPIARDLFQASLTAMIEAQRSGPAAVRCYSETMRERLEARRRLADDVPNAFAEGQICAYFQPQLSTVTGDIAGFEALARWQHPNRGPVPPLDFLPAIQDAGAMDRLGHFMIREALGALRKWENHGLFVPRVGVNLSSIELSNPQLTKTVEAELQAFGIAADRLTFEVLETVIASQVSGTVIENLATLARMGCGIDLDDFGTGYASITTIRRFSIERIKIDRSFVSNIDDDSEQQKMVHAILTMAEKLGLDALAEGVETPSEQAMLTKLGCEYIQGYGVAHPMPLSKTLDWIAAFEARRTPPIRMAGRTG